MNRAQRRAAQRANRGPAPIPEPHEPNYRNRLASQKGITMSKQPGEQPKSSDDFKQEFQQRMLERVLGGGTAEPSGTDPDLLAVLRELRDNTGRIARALESGNRDA